MIDVSDGPAKAAATSAEPNNASKKPAASGDSLIPGLPDDLVASIVGVRKTVKPPALAPASSAAGAPNPSAAGKAPSSTPLGTAQPVTTGSTVATPSTSGCLLLPTGRLVGIAMYRQGSDTVVVLDRALTPPPGGDGSWWQAHAPQVTQTAEWTALRVPTHGEGIRIERQVDGLCLIGTPGLPSSEATIAYQSRDASVSFALAHPGRTLTVIDPVTRALLLVGTDGGSSGSLRPRASIGAVFHR